VATTVDRLRPQLLAQADPTVRWAQAVVLAAATLTIAAGLIHGLVAPHHVMEYAEGELPGWLPLAFALTAGAGLALGAALILGPVTRGLLVVVGASHAVMAAAGIASRTVGLPGAGVEATDPAWAVAVFCELAVTVLVVGLLVWGPGRVRLSRGRQLAALGLVVAAAVVAVLVVPDFLDHARMIIRPTLAGWMWLASHPDGWMW